MEHGNLNHHSVSGGNVHSVTDYFAVVNDVIVREHNTLGESRCARSILHICNVVAVNCGCSAVNFLNRNPDGHVNGFFPCEAALLAVAYGDNVAQERQLAAVERLTGCCDLKLGAKLSD